MESKTLASDVSLLSFFKQQLDLTLGIKIGADLSQQQKKKGNWGTKQQPMKNRLLEQLPRADATRPPLPLLPLASPCSSSPG